MAVNKIYEKLRKEHYFYCQGKRPSVLKAACEYIESRIAGGNLTLYKIYLQKGVHPTTILTREKEIVKMLKLEKEANWKWL